MRSKKTADSLKKLIAAAKEDTAKVLLMFKLSHVYLNSKPDSAMLIVQQEMLLSRKANYLIGEARAVNIEGIVFDVAGNYPKALSCFLSALKINEKRNDRLRITVNLGNIGSVYSHEGDYRQSIQFQLKAKKMAELTHDEGSLATELISLGDSYEKLDILDSARVCTQQGYELALKQKDNDLIGIATNNLGNIYSKMHNPHIALEYYRTAIPYSIQAGDDDNMCETTLGMAKLFKQLNQPDSCLYYAKRSMAAGVHGGFTVRVFNASQFLTSYFKEQGRLDSAFHYQELSITAKDSLFSQEKTKEVQNLTFAERQRQEELAEQKLADEEASRKNLQLAGIAIFIPMFFLFVMYLSRHKAKPRTVEFLGILALLLVFEFVTLLVHPYIERWTHETPILTLLILVAIAAILVPLHHRTEHWVKSKLVHRAHPTVAEASAG